MYSCNSARLQLDNFGLDVLQARLPISPLDLGQVHAAWSYGRQVRCCRMQPSMVAELWLGHRTCWSFVGMKADRWVASLAPPSFLVRWYLCDVQRVVICVLPACSSRVFHLSRVAWR